MKKFILPILFLFTVLFFLSSKVNAQTDADCSYKNYEWESYRCFEVFNSCQKACSDKAKGSYLDEISPADKYGACMKASDCHGKTRACRDQAWANYQACKESLKAQESPQVKNSPSPSKLDTKSDAKEDSPKKAVQKEKNPLEKLSDMPVFIGDWFERISLAWAGLSFLDVSSALGKEILTDPEIAIWEEEQRQKDIKYYIEPFLQENIGRPAQITLTDEQKAWESSLNDVLPDKENITVVKGEGRLKTAGSGQFISLTSKETPVFVSFLDSAVSGSNSEPLQLLYTWGVDAGSVINVSPQTKAQFLEPVKDEQTQDITRTVKFNQGEIEVKTQNTNPQNKFKVQTNSVSVVASRTHFWVRQSMDKNQTAVGVYEGEVQITTKDGKTTSLVPNGNKPGVVVITQKFSTIKLAVASLVLVVVVGGVFWFVRGRKLNSSRKR
ncbi:FecR domain-containing protein [Candidatus Daviesbacteria bacterium]|nr:FecR domain-containing protein [Candidatus Daviesbacteria bacterium]